MSGEHLEPPADNRDDRQEDDVERGLRELAEEQREILEDWRTHRDPSTAELEARVEAVARRALLARAAEGSAPEGSTSGPDADHAFGSGRVLGAPRRRRWFAAAAALVAIAIASYALWPDGNRSGDTIPEARDDTFLANRGTGQSPTKPIAIDEFRIVTWNGPEDGAYYLEILDANGFALVDTRVTGKSFKLSDDDLALFRPGEYQCRVRPKDTTTAGEQVWRFTLLPR